MKKVYIAGSYSRRQELLDYSLTLLVEKYQIVSSWLKGPDQLYTNGEVLGSEFEHLMEAGLSTQAKIIRKTLCLRDFSEIYSCDLFIIFTQITPSRGGSCVEFGYAWSLSKEIIIIGPESNCFFSLCPRVDTWKDFIANEHLS